MLRLQRYDFFRYVQILFWNNTKLYCSEGEAEEAEKDACEAGDFLLGIGLAEDENAIEEGNDRAAAADGGDDGYHRIGVAQRQHIDIVGQDQEHGNAGDGSRTP